MAGRFEKVNVAAAVVPCSGRAFLTFRTPPGHGTLLVG